MLKKKQSIKMRKILPEHYFCSSDLPGEEWIKLVNWRGIDLKYPYWISNKGRVRNADLDLLAGQESEGGYHWIQLSFVDHDRPCPIHTLVLTLFQGPPPAYMIDPTVNHIDHQCLNNCIENLEWLSRSANGKDGSLFSYPASSIQIELQCQDGSVSVFDKQWDADTYLNHAHGYISQRMRNQFPVMDAFNREVVLRYRKKYSTDDWSCYSPKRLPLSRQLICVIQDSSGEHMFLSPSGGSRYLGQCNTYLVNQFKKHKQVAVNALTGEEVTFDIFVPQYLSETLLRCTVESAEA